MLDSAEIIDSPLAQMGARVRKLRTEKGITLAELSVISQVSVGMLSHIERGQTSPSLKTLERLRIALDVHLGAFFEPSDATAQYGSDLVVRAESRAQIPFSSLGLTKELLSPAGHSSLEMLMLVIEPGGSSGADPWTRSGEKAGYVISGKFELTIGSQPHVLDVGDSFQFDSSIPHSFRNLAAGPTRVIWIINSSAPG